MTHKPLTDDELTNHKRLTVSMGSNFSFTEELRQRMLATIDALKAELAALKAAQQMTLTEDERRAVKCAENAMLNEDADELEDDEVNNICWALIRLSDRLTNSSPKE